jgi:hypothetical protein
VTTSTTAILQWLEVWHGLQRRPQERVGIGVPAAV